MSYKDLVTGLIYEGETLQVLNNFTFLKYTHVRFCNDASATISQRSGGICLLTNKRLLFLSSQLTLGELIVTYIGWEIMCAGGNPLQNQSYFICFILSNFNAITSIFIVFYFH